MEFVFNSLVFVKSSTSILGLVYILLGPYYWDILINDVSVYLIVTIHIYILLGHIDK